ncbi:MAG: hypothetical protein KC468_35975, partial [Myxococcales bacterium]|nr:hypothetical protein [Myxococcales bacterium]
MQAPPTPPRALARRSCPRAPLVLSASLVVLACTGGAGETESGTDSATAPTSATNGMTSPSSGASTTAGGETGGASDMTESTSSETTTTGDASASSDVSASSDGGPKLDVGAPDAGEQETEGTTGDGCTSVDLLFVIDNSVSMGDYQNALGLAFPGFADAIIESLPPGTNLHVGVTSTTMGYSSLGITQNCVATGDNNVPQDGFYETPDMVNNGLNGAQGRLFDPGGGVYYYDIDTDADPAEVQGLKDWFADAAKVGTGGSQIEMATAPVGWVADPANNASNAGFIRDEG